MKNEEKLALLERLKCVRHVALDLDGTVYCGNELFPQTLPFLETLRSLGIGYSFLTNNSSKGVEEYRQHLSELGIDVVPDDIFTSGHATIELLGRITPDVRRIFMVGTPALRRQFEAAKFEVLDETADIAPDVVIVGFDTDLRYSNLCKAAYWIAQGHPYFATHPDLLCPTNQPTLLLDCGAICAAIASATGRQPDAVAGKPEPAMLQLLAARVGVEVAQMAMVGDRLYTDLLMARRANAFGVLMLTGETKREHLSGAEVQPDLVIEHLGELAQWFGQAHHSEI